MNPFLSVWFKPKATTSYMIEQNKKKLSLIILMIAGIGGLLNALQETGINSVVSPALIAIIVLIGGPIIGLGGYYIGSWLYTVVGGWLDGSGTVQEMRKTFGLTGVTNLVLTVVVVIYVMIYGELYFQRPGFMEISVLPEGSALLLGAISFILGIWNMIITSKMTGVVHRFSSWKGFLVNIILGVAIALITIPVVFFITAFSIL
ncbi:YIP1 family protein [Jeotgalibacillus aurantiacus]|uniref:YIP1 family protein n=1 Tax=Jeotgalibacillus aurantiacus TaxID=2763266 RepID=UPI001D0A4F77|nr:YIP1 family protein [Jeotgalibacillus aurantiacus]